MSLSAEALKEIEIQIGLAEDKVTDMCNGSGRWRMSIPVNADDHDVVISVALRNAYRLLDEIDRLRDAERCLRETMAEDANIIARQTNEIVLLKQGMREIETSKRALTPADYGYGHGEDEPDPVFDAVPFTETDTETLAQEFREAVRKGLP